MHACEKLTSEERIKHRERRRIESETVFEQMKYNMAYRCFWHMGKDKVIMDFAFFAIAFNIRKMCAKLTKEGYDPLCIIIYGLYRRVRVLYRPYSTAMTPIRMVA